MTLDETSTTLLAFQNLDWTIIDANLVYKCIYPHLLNPQNLIAVKIHITKLGKEKIPIEEKNGPSINKDIKLEDAIYAYNQERKRYYLAVAYFKCKEEAENIYKILDGLEIMKNNYFDCAFLENYTFYEAVNECNKIDNKKVVLGEETDWEDDDKMKRICDALFDDEDEIDDEMVNALIDVSEDMEENNTNTNNGFEDEYRKKQNSDRSASKRIEDNRKVDDDLSVFDENKKIKENVKEIKKAKSKTSDKKSKLKDLIEKKKKKKAEKDEEFKIDLTDVRFNAVFDDDFNIDVTHKNYKSNDNLKQIIREKRNKNKNNL